MAWIETHSLPQQVHTFPASPPARVAWIETYLLEDVFLANGCGVATREGGVDRNASWAAAFWRAHGSPPARVAWIETAIRAQGSCTSFVATREGGVDRNL